ncbi:MAG: radical SAM/SPASM domain-containing protein [Nanobdellota archaeon]
MSVPIEIVVELTTRCNLSCSFCYNRDNNQKDSSHSSIITILDQIADLGVQAVRFTGGEPLLREDLEDILRKAKKRNLYVILNTNGTLLKRNAHITKHVDLFLISMHGPERFSLVSDLLNTFSDSKFLLATIALKENINNLQKFYRFVNALSEKNNFQEWFFLRPISCSNSNISLKKKQINELKDKILLYNKEFSMNIKIANAIPLCAAEDLDLVSKGGKFDLGHGRLYVKTDGRIFADYSEDIYLGNILDSSISEIWNSGKIKEITNFRNIWPVCKNCHMLEKCRGGFKEDFPLVEPENIKPLISVVVSGPCKRIIKELSMQRCRKSVFEILTLKDVDSTSDLRINPNTFSSRNEAANKARSKKLIFLNHAGISKNFILKHLKKRKQKPFFDSKYKSKKYSFSVEKQIFCRFGFDESFESYHFQDIDFFIRSGYYSGDIKDSLDKTLDSTAESNKLVEKWPHLKTM